MRTRMTELLGITHPIIQASMAWITDGELAAAVSEAGGLGTIGPNAGCRAVTRGLRGGTPRFRQDAARRLREGVGQGAGMIDEIPSCRELMERMVGEAESVLERLNGIASRPGV